MIKKIFAKTLHKLDALQSHSVGAKGNISVTCFGGAEEVTGSNFMLEFFGVKAIVDAGLPQGKEAHHHEWDELKYDPKEASVMLITHAHMDHIGRIPFLVSKGFRGKIFSTKATKEMAQLALKDAYHILMKEYDKGSIFEMPYKESDIERTFSLWNTVEYRQEINILNFVNDKKLAKRMQDDPMNKKFSAKFFNSSHVLGSAFIQFNCGGEKVLFTGDMGSNSLLLPEADIPTDSDVVFMETVYGGRVHEHLDDRTEFLLETIQDVISKHGTLVMPAFSIERTQEILSEINNFVERKKIPILPVFLDSPLSIDVTKIFHKHFNDMRENIREQVKRGDDIFKFPGLRMTDSKEESMEIHKTHGPKIIIAGSGMIAGGRVIHHVKKYLSGKNNTILLAGYQAPGTYGRLLTENKKEIVFYGEPLEVNAKIVQLSGYSAHRDKNDLIKFVDVIKNNCKSLNLILGDAESLLEFKRSVMERFGVSAHICLKGEKIEL